MPPAVAAAGIAAAGAIGGGIMSAHAQKKAAGQAADVSLQTAQENNALAREFRDANQANFQPWLNSGNRANSMLDSFLYGPGPTNYYTGAMPANAAPSPSPTPAPAPQPAPAAGSAPPRHMLGGFAGGLLGALHSGQDLGLPSGGPLAHGDHIQTSGGTPNALLGGATGTPAPGGTVNTPAPTAGQGQSPFSGYAAFINSPYYQFGQKEGMRSLNTGLASRGMIESGDAIKSAVRYGQDYGYSQGLMPYMNMLGQQSDRGIQGASAIAGVGQNALSSMTANNNMAGNVAANAALARGAANAGMYSSIGSALGGLAGSFGGSSYRGY